MALTYYFKNFPKVIAHRGLSALAPENTLAAFRLAAQKGISWIETDVRLSKDNVPMLFHDAELDRTSNGLGLFNQFTQSELQSLDAGSWFSDEFKQESIPTLEQALDLSNELSIHFNLEIKPNIGEEIATVEQIKNVLLKRAKLPQILLSSFHPEALIHAKEILPDIPRALVIDDLVSLTAEEVINLTEALGCTSLHIHHSLLMSPLINQCYYAPFDIMCYTVNEQSLASQCYRAGAVSVFSDTGLF